MKIEQELRKSEQKLRVLFNQSPDIIMTVDEAGKCLMINHPLQKQYREDNDQGSAVFLSQKVQEKYKEVLKTVLQTGAASEIQFSGDDHFCWELRIVPLRMTADVAVAMVIMKDITEKRMLEANTIRNARLASLGVLAASVAHEINNPQYHSVQYIDTVEKLERYSWYPIGLSEGAWRFYGGGVPVEQALTGTPPAGEY